jgi:hypothetical protein
VNLSLSLTNGMGLSSGTDRGVLIANRANTTVTETSDGYRITKTGGAAAWDADATSAANTAGDFVIYSQARQTNANFMVGVNADPALDSNFTSLDRAIWFASDGTIHSTEGGVAGGVVAGGGGNYTTSDYIILSRVGTAVEILKSATKTTVGATVMHTFTAYSATAHFDSSFETANGAVDVRVVF